MHLFHAPFLTVQLFPELPGNLSCEVELWGGLGVFLYLSCVVTRHQGEVPSPQQNAIIIQRVYKTAARKTCQSLQAGETELLGWTGWEDGMRGAEHIPEPRKHLGAGGTPDLWCVTSGRFHGLVVVLYWHLIFHRHFISWTLNIVEICNFFFFSER